MAITDPRDIPGLVAWYSAEAEAANWSDGAQMTSWSDLSGNGNHATGMNTGTDAVYPYWHASGGAGGGPRVRFSGVNGNGGHFQLPTNVMSGVAAGEAMAHTRVTDINQSSGLWWIGSQDDRMLYPEKTSGTDQGRIWDTFGSTARKISSTFTTTPLLSWHRYGAWSAAGDWQTYRNLTTVHSTTSNVVGWATTPTLGYGGPITSSGRYQGDISCFVIFNRKLTATERADLDAWMVAHPSGGTTGAPSPVTVAGSVANVLVAGQAGSPFAPVAISGAVANVSVAALAGSAVAGSTAVTVAGATANIAVTAYVGTASAGVAPAVPVETSTRYANDGYNYDGTAAVYFEPPIAEPPAHIRRAKVQQVHQSMSAPNLVNGVPR